MRRLSRRFHLQNDTSILPLIQKIFEEAKKLSDEKRPADEVNFAENPSLNVAKLFSRTVKVQRKTQHPVLQDALVFYIQDTFQNFWVLTLWKLSSVLMAFTDSESCAGLHAEGNIAGSADLNWLISQSTANSPSPTYLLVQNTGSITQNGEVLHRAPVSTLPCPELKLLNKLQFFLLKTPETTIRSFFSLSA
ncbi:unnamed protein product [Schistocephalus solidus]|uniref:Uncharacterized protein n=1 Tax=Schistocephalus solidus TaxID=70667 RepID=A0A3P7D7G1_SCHSO|nr:unnamed protein product [Schistocephalus solidus]